MTADSGGYLRANVRTTLAIIAVTGMLGFVAAALRQPEAAWSSFLNAAFFWITLALGGLVFLALGHVGSAGWPTILRRVSESMAAWLPLGALTMLATLIGVPWLYHWAHADAVAHDAVLAAKAAYLNRPFFAARMVVALAAWLFFFVALRRASRRQDDADRNGAIASTRRSVALSAAFLMTFAVTFSMASFDWIMSLEPHWISTIFALYNIAGVLVAGVAGIIVFAVLLHRRGYLPELRADHLHDLGKYLFGFATLWAYLWFSQYMLIWYANIPEETQYYVARTQAGWQFLFYLNPLLGWAIPFMVLLPRAAKRSEGHLYRVALWMLGCRWLDIYLMVGPSASPVHAGVSILDVALFVSLGCAFVLACERALRRAPLLPKNDPFLGESLHHHV